MNDITKDLAYFAKYFQNDAEYSAQKEQYGRAIPSRDFILELLQNQPNIGFEEVASIFKLRKNWELDALENRLNAMIRQGTLYLDSKEKLQFINPDKTYIGTVSGHAEGYGFLDVKGEPSLFIPPHEMKNVLHGDTAEAAITGVDNRGRRIVSVIKVIEHGLTEMIGRFYRHEGVSSVIPENRKVTQEFLIDEANTLKAKNLDIVRIKITDYPSENTIAKAEVTEVFGEEMTVDIEIMQAILEHNIPHQFSKETEKEIQEIPDTVLAKELTTRKDYRDLPLVTIDGITARDFDDAVYCEKLENGHHKLYVAISDVAHYVLRNSAIDQDAYLRSTSVYFPNHVVPMLHQKLSNGICSLNPDVDRLIMMAELTIDQSGDLTHYEFFEGVMRSKARLTYELVQEIVDGDGALRETYDTLVPHLDNLYALYKILRRARNERGTIDFDTVETLVLYDEDGEIDKIVPDARFDSHKIIEECMITANIAAAKFIEESKLSVLYRVHPHPDSAKLKSLREFLKEFKLGLSGGDEPSPMDYANTLEAAKELPAFNMIQTVMLRSLSQAIYQPENDGHFGLALTHYAHFTAPIRRYPDLITHRAIKLVLQNGDKEQFYPEKHMVQMGEHTSMAERRADDATRDVMDWLKAKYLERFIGDEFDGKITSITSFGMFVELENIFIEGLVHISQLQGDYFIYDDARHRLIGERTRQQYRLSDPVRVKVVESNPETKHIDFELISPVVEGGNDKKSAGERAVPKRSRGKGNNDSDKKSRHKKSGRIQRDDAAGKKSKKRRKKAKR
ncbi:ribonuclease R [Ignatzschineria rhizosphaerae]|uniref:Ribonuclease R n=1 Tax=Ignatzschineria rhizosphaerae TaxID=2923279 RepID=A0ABY3X9I0_9GAMM|nr:ribonuclease R [Ignatzschineria rhizosphaerae]UNM97381.1 ribonuclease R [Ignatzschineria rhizosphaerae]